MAKEKEQGSAAAVAVVEAKPETALVDVISVYPTYMLAIDRGEHGLAEMDDGTMTRIERKKHKHVEFSRHRAKMTQADYDKVKARDTAGFGREWMGLHDYRALRKAQPKLARSFKLAFKRRLEAYPPRDMLYFRKDEAAREEYVEEVFQE